LIDVLAPLAAGVTASAVKAAGEAGTLRPRPVPYFLGGGHSRRSVMKRMIERDRPTRVPAGMLRSLLLIVITLGAIPLRAQHDTILTAALFDSLQAFQARMLAEPILTAPPLPTAGYELVWEEHDNGYYMTITQTGTGATADLQRRSEHAARLDTLPDATYFGERYLLLISDVPVSMLDRTRLYYQRR
jgi:hypothetical protein